jgi:phenylacetate-CoA ligase
VGGEVGRSANAALERLEPERLDALVERAVLRHLATYADSPLYRRHYARHSFDPASVRSLADFRRLVPPLGKRDVLEHQRAVGDGGEEDTRQFHLTSGTSGIGQEIHRRAQGDLAALGTGGAWEFIWGGLGRGDRMMLTMPYSQTMAGPYFQGACEAAGIVPVNGFSASTEARLEQLYDFACKGLVITPSYLHRLTTAAAEAGRRPAEDLPSLTSIFLSGEPYGLDWAGEMSRAWGADLYEGWGATQTLGVVMATCDLGAVQTAGGEPRRGAMHALEHRCLIEVVDPESGEEVEPGETGEIVVTTLRSGGLPCIRFRMGDVVRRLGRHGCACGRAFEAFEAGSISRLDDMVKIRGMNVWPSAVDEVVLGGPVREYRARVFTDGAGRESVALRVEVGDAVAGRDDLAGQLRRRLKEQVGVSVEVEVVGEDSFAENDFKSRRWSDERAVRGAAR